MRPERTAIYIPQAWDSRFFGFPVARIDAEELSTTTAIDALARAADDGYRLVYWFGSPHQQLPEDVLSAFTGKLVDQRAVFRRPLFSDRDPVARYRDGLVLATHPVGKASDSLVRLALKAGEWSRFRVDPLFPQNLFESLYAHWIDRCARTEIADAVLVVMPPDALERTRGMVTIAVDGNVGSIGLLAVDESLRGRGWGRALVDCGHEHMQMRGCTSASVTTQLANGSACALYEGAGYALAQTQNIYHFWPSEGGHRVR